MILETLESRKLHSVSVDATTDLRIFCDGADTVTIVVKSETVTKNGIQENIATVNGQDFDFISTIKVTDTTPNDGNGITVNVTNWHHSGVSTDVIGGSASDKAKFSGVGAFYFEGGAGGADELDLTNLSLGIMYNQQPVVNGWANWLLNGELDGSDTLKLPTSASYRSDSTWDSSQPQTINFAQTGDIAVRTEYDEFSELQLVWACFVAFD